MPAGTLLLLTINSNVSEPERLFTTISQLNSVMPSNLLVSFKPPIYPDTLPDQFFVTHLDFVPSKTQFRFGCRRDLQKYTTNETSICWQARVA